MKKIKEILLSKRVGEFLNHRETATELINSLKELKSNRVVLNFSDVEFMSRSFADQFYKDLISFQKENFVTIKLSNKNEEVERILQSVKNTQNKTNRDYTEFPVREFSNSKELSKYLMTV